MKKMFSLILSAYIILTGCKPNADESSLKTLDKLAGIESGTNRCSGNFANNSTSMVSYGDRIKNRKELDSAVAEALSSVPKLVKMGFNTHFGIHIDSNVKRFCKGSNGDVCIKNTVHEKNPIKKYTLYIDADKKNGVTAEARIRHSIVRSYGYYVARFMGESAINLPEGKATDYPGNLNFTSFFQKANADLVKAFNLDMLRLKKELKGVNSKNNRNLGLIVFPEAFDSYYCNTKTRISMKKNFPMSYKFFQPFVKALETLERNPRTSGFNLASKAIKSEDSKNTNSFALQNGATSSTGFGDFTTMVGSGYKEDNQPVRPGKLADMSTPQLERYAVGLRQQNDAAFKDFGWSDSNWSQLAEQKRAVGQAGLSDRAMSWIPGVRSSEEAYKDSLKTTILEQETQYQDYVKQKSISDPRWENLQPTTMDPAYPGTFADGQRGESPSKIAAAGVMKEAASTIAPGGFPFKGIEVGLPIDSRVDNTLKAGGLADTISGSSSNFQAPPKVTVIPGATDLLFKQAEQRQQIATQSGVQAMQNLQTQVNQHQAPSSFGPSTLNQRTNNRPQYDINSLPPIPQGVSPETASQWMGLGPN